MRATLFSLLIGLALASPARAELLKFEERDGTAQASLTIEAKAYLLALKLARPPKPAADATLLLDATGNEDVAAVALARGMSVATADFATLPAAARAQALRDLAPRLRRFAGVRRLLGRAKGETAAAFATAGAAFDGLLLQDATALPAAAPRLIETWGSDAYWRAAPRPAPGPGTPDRRRFFIAGGGAAAEAANCAAAVNTRIYAPAARALLVVLDDWTRGKNPPPSRAPGPADLVPAQALVWPKIPGLPARPPGDRLVPKIDADGNETVGLRLPDQALPIATFTGFNASKEKDGPACAAGAALPFPATKSDREKAGDPRPALVERYGSRAYFVATMRIVADRLVKERLLLKEDADAYVAAAKQAPF